MKDRDKLVSEIGAMVSDPKLGFIPSWRSKTAPQLLTMLETMEDTDRLNALHRTVRLFKNGIQSRLTLLTYLMHPPASEETWQTITTISAHYPWLMKRPYMYDAFLQLVNQLDERHGIKPDANGRVKSIETHLAVKEAYDADIVTEQRYFQNKRVIQFVEKNYRHREALISYLGERGYNEPSDAAFKEYLNQHKALQEGWL